ncbi:MAG: AAA family ATPase [Gammaproteobacteria bacterium]|nr:AAA family ATPase [Gammaproteobacteria bacterium]
MPDILQLKPEVMVLFGLRTQPFDPPENPVDIFPSQQILGLRDSVEECLLTQNQLVFLIGETGSGSSTMAKYLISKSAPKLVYFTVQGNPSLNSTEILLAICKDFEDQELLLAATRQGKSISKFASTHLFALMKRDLQPVIIIDQIHLLNPRLINDIVRFAEAVNNRGKGLLKLVLTGTGQLEDFMKDIRGSWIEERQYREFKMTGLKKGEAKKYLLHRMKGAGLSVKVPFTEQTIMVLAERSGNIPAVLDRMVVESLNHRSTALVRAAEESAVLSDEETSAELAQIRKEKLRRWLPTLVILSLIACVAIGVLLSM